MTTVGNPKTEKEPVRYGRRYTWVNRTLVGTPKIDERPEQPYLGIRVQTPFKGMFSVTGKLLKELNGWMKKQGIAAAGLSFLRFYIIDMDGEMDVEVGVPVAAAAVWDGRVCPATLPGGRYASLVFIGNGYTGNSVLIRWGIEQGLVWDRWDDPRGDAFRSRYEANLTDPKIEPLKKKWEVEVAIKLAD